jgi:diguanylate cyclase (GGDEF)-like protein/PAS domain S-box-containing protein
MAQPLSVVSLPARTALGAGALVLAVGGPLSLWHAAATRDLLIAQAALQLRQVEQSLAADLAGPQPLDETRLAALRQAHGLAYLTLQDRREPPPLEGGGGRDGTPRSAPDLQAALRGAAHHYHGELRLPPPAGLVRYGVGLAPLRQARRNALLAGIALLAGVEVLALALGAALGVRLRRQLGAAAGTLGQLADEGRAPRMVPRGPPEFAALARRVNGAIASIEQRLAALAARESRLRAIAEGAFGVEAWFSPQGKLVWVNASIERVTGYTPLECVFAGNLVETLVYQKDRKFALEQGLRALQGAQPENLEFRLQHKAGGIVWVAVNWQAIHDADGRYLGLRVSVADIQQRKQAEMQLLETVAELRRAQSLQGFYLTRANEERARLQALLDVMKVGVLFFDRDRRVLFCNEALLSTWRMPAGTVLTGMREESLMAATQALRVDDAAYRAHFAAVMDRTESSAPFEFVLNDGRTLMDVSALVPGSALGSHIGRVWIYEDVSEQKRVAARLIELAERDSLTNLYNRRRFHEELERMLADAERRAVQLGLLVIDLDGFKPINDRYGHQAGDTVLVRLAREVSGTVRRNEIFFRIGGDEFAILAPDSSEEELVGLARRILAKIADTRFRFDDAEVRLSASVGIAVYPAHARDGRELMERSDQAMYRAKTGGKNAWQVWRERSAV